MHKSVVIGALSGALLFAAAAVAAEQAAKPTDPQIAQIAYTAGVLDIEAAKQALDKSKNSDVRAFAQQMVGDHTNAALSDALIPNAQNAELKALLQSGLGLFQAHQKHAEQLAGQLQSSSASQ